MFTKVKINDFQTYWPITQTQANCHNAFSPFNYRTYYLRILPRYGTLSQGWFYNFLYSLNAKGFISFHDVCRCGDCWVYIFDNLDNSEDDLSNIMSGKEDILRELKKRLTDYEGLPLPDLEFVHPINKFVLFSLGVFSGDWQYNKLIGREI